MQQNSNLTEKTAHNMDYASGGLTGKLGVLCSETRPNAIPRTVMCQLKIRPIALKQRNKTP